MRSVNLFAGCHDYNIPFQIPDPELAMAEEETSSREVPKRRGPTKGTQRRRGDSGGPAAEDDPLAQDVITIDSGDEDPRHHQVSSFLGNFCLRRRNPFIQQAVPLVPGPVKVIRPLQEVVGPIVWVKTEEGESLLERVPLIEKPVAVQKSPPQSVASLEIPSVAEKLPEIQVGFSRKSCSEHSEFSFQVESVPDVSQRTLPFKKRLLPSPAPSSSSPPLTVSVYY